MLQAVVTHAVNRTCPTSVDNHAQPSLGIADNSTVNLNPPIATADNQLNPKVPSAAADGRVDNLILPTNTGNCGSVSETVTVSKSTPCHDSKDSSGTGRALSSTRTDHRLRGRTSVWDRIVVSKQCDEILHKKRSVRRLQSLRENAGIQIPGNKENTSSAVQEKVERRVGRGYRGRESTREGRGKRERCLSTTNDVPRLTKRPRCSISSAACDGERTRIVKRGIVMDREVMKRKREPTSRPRISVSKTKGITNDRVSKQNGNGLSCARTRPPSTAVNVSDLEQDLLSDRSTCRRIDWEPTSLSAYVTSHTGESSKGSREVVKNGALRPFIATLGVSVKKELSTVKQLRHVRTESTNSREMREGLVVSDLEEGEIGESSEDEEDDEMEAGHTAMDKHPVCFEQMDQHKASSPIDVIPLDGEQDTLTQGDQYQCTVDQLDQDIDVEKDLVIDTATHHSLEPNSGSDLLMCDLVVEGGYVWASEAEVPLNSLNLIPGGTRMSLLPVTGGDVTSSVEALMPVHSKGENRGSIEALQPVQNEGENRGSIEALQPVQNEGENREALQPVQNEGDNRGSIEALQPVQNEGEALTATSAPIDSVQLVQSDGDHGSVEALKPVHSEGENHDAVTAEDMASAPIEAGQPVYSEGENHDSVEELSSLQGNDLTDTARPVKVTPSSLSEQSKQASPLVAGRHQPCVEHEALLRVSPEQTEEREMPPSPRCMATPDSPLSPQKMSKVASEKSHEEGCPELVSPPPPPRQEVALVESEEASVHKSSEATPATGNQSQEASAPESRKEYWQCSDIHFGATSLHSPALEVTQQPPDSESRQSPSASMETSLCHNHPLGPELRLQVSPEPGEDTVTIFPDVDPQSNDVIDTEEREEGELSGDDVESETDDMDSRPPTPSSSPYKNESDKPLAMERWKRRELKMLEVSGRERRCLGPGEDRRGGLGRKVSDTRNKRLEQNCSVRNHLRFPDLEPPWDCSRGRGAPRRNDRPPAHWGRYRDRSRSPPPRERRLRPRDHRPPLPPSPPLPSHHALHRQRRRH